MRRQAVPAHPGAYREDKRHQKLAFERRSINLLGREIPHEKNIDLAPADHTQRKKSENQPKCFGIQMKGSKKDGGRARQIRKKSRERKSAGHRESEKPGIFKNRHEGF